MGQREKQCSYCGKFFFYEDGVDTHGIALTRENSNARADNRELTVGLCPNCVDPHSVPGLTYLKSTILKIFRSHLWDKGIDESQIDDDSLVTMLWQFPIAEKLYHSNGTYRTFTLLPNLVFKGKYGEFTMGIAVEKYTQTDYVTQREITCNRCNKATFYDTRMALFFYTGMNEKQCYECDSALFMVEHKRNTNGLNRNGSAPKKDSIRTLARQFNVSRNEYRRNPPTVPVPSLPIGTVVSGLRILEAYWCEDTDTPKYRLICDRCQMLITITQKQVTNLSHPCRS